jgi:anti-anti-sigma regulatory factor
LVTKEPLDLWFKPIPGAWPNNVLPVAPDMLPAGSVKISQVWIDGKPYDDFDPKALTVTLPDMEGRPKVRVELVPAHAVQHFDADLVLEGTSATLTMSGALDPLALSELRTELEQLVAAGPGSLILNLEELTAAHPAGIRSLVFACQKLPLTEDVVVTGASREVAAAFRTAGFAGAVGRGGVER